MFFPCNVFCWDIFIIKKLLYNLVQTSGWDVIISLRAWVWCRCQNRVEKTFIFRSSRPDVFCKKGVLRNLAKFIGKHLCQGLFFNKAAGLSPEKEALAQVFSCEFCKISKNTHLFHRTPLVAASVYLIYIWKLYAITIKKSCTFANLLMGKPGNWVAIANKWE